MTSQFKTIGSQEMKQNKSWQLRLEKYYYFSLMLQFDGLSVPKSRCILVRSHYVRTISEFGQTEIFLCNYQIFYERLPL